MFRSLIRFLLIAVLCCTLFLFAFFIRAVPAIHATNAATSSLSVSVGYAEDKETNTPPPGAFPNPWAGSPNITFLGSPVVGPNQCGALPSCYDAGAIRFDNSGSSGVVINNVTVDDHSSLPGGKVFSLWGSFTVPAGQGVIITEDPPNDNPGYNNFDTSGYPSTCTPISVEPTVTISIGNVSTMLVDTNHILDTGGIDLGSCKPKANESSQWQSLGTVSAVPAIQLNPAMITLYVGQSTTETATVLDSNGNPVSKATVAFSIKSGPNAGLTVSATTGITGQATFTYTSNGTGIDTVIAEVTLVSAFQSTSSTVVWVDDNEQGWSNADIGSPTLPGWAFLSNGIWTVAGAGRDIGGNADQFHFVWQSLTSDGGIRAQVLSQTNANSEAKAGVMLRQSTDAGSPFYAVMVTTQKGLVVLERATPDGGVKTVISHAGKAPLYLEVERTSTTFTAYTSNDGITWTPVLGSTVVFNMSGTLLAGIAVTSHAPNVLNTATFGSVSTP